MKTADQFGDQVVALLPDLKAFGRFLCKSADQGDDLVQDTVMRALCSRESYQDGTNLKAWLFTIMRNLRINSFRRRMLECIDDVPEPTIFPDTDLAVDVHAMLETMKLLPPDMRAVLNQIGMGDTYEDIAARMGVELGTVKSRVNRARAMLEFLIEGRGLNRALMMEAA